MFNSTEFVNKYNGLLDRLDKADSFLEKFGGKVEIVHHNNKPFEIDTVLDMYNSLIKEISAMHKEYFREFSLEMTIEEKEFGFGRK